jgi:hypothetical protein
LDRSPGRQQQQYAAVGSDLSVVLDLTADVIILPPVDDKKIFGDRVLGPNSQLLSLPAARG